MVHPAMEPIVEAGRGLVTESPIIHSINDNDKDIENYSNNINIDNGDINDNNFDQDDNT